MYDYTYFMNIFGLLIVLSIITPTIVNLVVYWNFENNTNCFNIIWPKNMEQTNTDAELVEKYGLEMPLVEIK